MASVLWGVQSVSEFILRDLTFLPRLVSSLVEMTEIFPRDPLPQKEFLWGKHVRTTWWLIALELLTGTWASELPAHRSFSFRKILAFSTAIVNQNRKTGNERNCNWFLLSTFPGILIIINKHLLRDGDSLPVFCLLISFLDEGKMIYYICN